MALCYPDGAVPSQCRSLVLKLFYVAVAWQGNILFVSINLHCGAIVSRESLLECVRGQCPSWRVARLVQAKYLADLQISSQERVTYRHPNAFLEASRRL